MHEKLLKNVSPCCNAKFTVKEGELRCAECGKAHHIEFTWSEQKYIGVLEIPSGATYMMFERGIEDIVGIIGPHPAIAHQLLEDNVTFFIGESTHGKRYILNPPT